MFDTPAGRIICWILAVITVLGGVNYLFIGAGKDLVPKITTKANGQKAIYYTFGICAVLYLVMKVLHHSQMSSTSFYF